MTANSSFLSPVLREHQADQIYNRQNISKSLLAMKSNQRKHETDIIEKQKQKIQSIVKTLSSRSIVHRVAKGRRRSSVAKVQPPKPTQQIPMDSPGPTRVCYNKINTGWKPGHRYKTSMIEYQGKIFLYGGLGCQKLLAWCCFDLATKQWSQVNIDDSIQNLQNRPRFARYSHTTLVYKNKAIIYGGFMLEVCSDVSLFDLDCFQYDTGSRGPARRDHAAIMHGKYMVVHGGVQQGNVISNEFYVYNAEQNIWSELKVFGQDKPYLSHHKIVSTIRKSRKQVRYGDNSIPEELYMFGGRNAEGVCVNDFYRIRIDGLTAKLQRVKAKGMPLPRSQHSLQFIESGFIVLHGGKTQEQINLAGISNGVLKDVHIFDILKGYWYEPIISNLVPSERFGMASTVIGSSVMVFGGCNSQHYHDADLCQIETDNNKMPKIIDRTGQEIPLFNGRNVNRLPTIVVKGGYDRLRA